MKSLSNLRALDAEQATIQTKLEPLNKLLSEKQKQLSTLRADIAAAESILDEAVKRHATVVAQQALGTAGADEVKQAYAARQAAQKVYDATQTSSAGVRHLISEIDATAGAGQALGVRLVAIAAEHKTATEAYLRDLADEAAAGYAATAHDLAERLGAVLAYQQALAAANYEPNLLTGAAWQFGVPSLNSPSARTAGGLLVGIENSRQQQPQQFAAIRQRIAADGVVIAGL